MKYLRGWEAIERKRKNEKVILNKHTDPTEEAVHNITLDQAVEVAKEDPSLIYAPMIWVSARRKRI